MEYNTQQRSLPLPEYGRSVQNMIDHALTIEDREERQLCANTIVKIMRGMFPGMRDTVEVNQRLWDHLAIMSDFKLDIDYPVELVKPESLHVKPETIAYPNIGLKYRHYGRLIQDMIKVASEYEEGEERKQLVNLIANRMKKNYHNWNKEGVDTQRIVDDIYELSCGKLEIKADDIKFFENRNAGQRRKQSANDKQKRRNNG